jgi:hypothetical protein
MIFILNNFKKCLKKQQNKYILFLNNWIIQKKILILSFLENKLKFRQRISEKLKDNSKTLYIFFIHSIILAY